MNNQNNLNLKNLSCFVLLLAITAFQSLMAQCVFEDLVIENTACNDLNEFDVVIDFNYAGGSDSFTIVGNGNNYGTFAKADAPVTLSSPFLVGDNQTIYEFVIADNESNFDCETIFGELGPLGCGPIPLCEINNLQMFFGDCDDLGNFFISLDFEYMSEGDTFDLAFTPGDAVLEPFAYADLPIQLGPFNNSNFQTFEATVYDQEDPTCTSSTTTSYFCNQSCTITGLNVEAGDCNPNGWYVLSIDFEVENPGNNFFDLFINQEFVGFYPLSDLPLSLDYGPTNGGGLVQVCINDNADCCAQMQYENPCNNNNCEIWDITAEATPCNDVWQYNVAINFEFANTNSSFTIVGNGNNYGTFSYADLPITLTDLQAVTMINEFIISDTDQPDCGGAIEFEAPNCNTNCTINDLIIEPYDCDADGNFLVDIDFEVVNSSDSFTVQVINNNTQVLSTFSYNDLYITMGPFVGNGSNYEFIINDQLQPDCGIVATLLSENCTFNPDCNISNLDVYPLTCNSDETYSALVIFDYENISSDVFDVYAGNGDYIGTFNYADLPLTLPSFPASGNANDVLTVCNSGNDLCCEIAEFEALACDDCEIVDVLLGVQPCNSDFNFMVNLDVDLQGGGALGFLVLGNGTNYGTFQYSDLPIELGPFDGDGFTAYEFIVVDLANTNCTGTGFIGPIDCQTPQPVWPGDVNQDFISNHYDLLNVGIAYGQMGPARIQTDINWMSFEGDNWTGFFANGANWKHADCNGDGTVDNIDLTAINVNYNETHGDVLPYDPIDLAAESASFFIDLPDFNEINLGEAFVAPIILGNLDTPVEEIYGIAFTVEYDPTMMDEAGVYVETGSSWLGEQGTQLISINKSFADQGIIEVAITRTDHNNTTGFGTISYFIGIIDDIAGKTELTIDITNVVAITYEEARISLETPTSIIDLTTSIEDVLKETVAVFPNPVAETLNIVTQAEEVPVQISIYNTLGQLMTRIYKPLQQQIVEVADWHAGIYFLDIQYSNGNISKKIEVSH